MTDLGTLGGNDSDALAINNSGVIVGWSEDASGRQDAFIRTGTKLTDLGNMLPGAISSVASDIDNSGDVVGHADTATGFYTWVYTGGAIVNVTQNTVTSQACCVAPGGALNKSFQIVPRGDLSSDTVPVLEPVIAYDENNPAVKYTGTWTRTASAGSWGGHVKTATKASASASLTFTGKRVWVVGPEGSNYGQVKVYMDGALKQTIDLQPDRGNRQTIYVAAFSAVSKHTIKLVVVGTPGRPSVSIDTVAVSQK